MLSEDEMSGVCQWHWVFEYPRSRLYTYLSLSIYIPSGIVYMCICVHLRLKVIHVSIVNSMPC